MGLIVEYLTDEQPSFLFNTRRQWIIPYPLKMYTVPVLRKATKPKLLL